MPLNSMQPQTTYLWWIECILQKQAGRSCANTTPPILCKYLDKTDFNSVILSVCFIKRYHTHHLAIGALGGWWFRLVDDCVRESVLVVSEGLEETRDKVVGGLIRTVGCVGECLGVDRGEVVCPLSMDWYLAGL